MSDYLCMTTDERARFVEAHRLLVEAVAYQTADDLRLEKKEEMSLHE